MAGSNGQYGSMSALPLVLFILCYIVSSVSPYSSIHEVEVTADGNMPLIMSEDDNCQDESPHCPHWAQQSECQKNPKYMLVYCRKSCGKCSVSRNENNQENQKPKGDLEMWGVPQTIGKSINKAKLRQKIAQMKSYIQVAKQNKTLSAVHDRCQTSLMDKLCIEWAIDGECDANPKYMNTKCAVACSSCEWLDITIRCPVEDPNAGVWKSGSLDAFFVNITSSSSSHHFDNVTILSQPPYGPWIVTIDGFISPEEANAMIAWGTKKGYERSGGVSHVAEKDGSVRSNIFDQRTSTNTWCSEKCHRLPQAKAILGRIENLTQIPPPNFEDLQLLHYDVGQFYKSHHDYIDFHLQRPTGVRILTVFLYLNDVKRGGGTRFTNLDGKNKTLTVEPKLGRALIWPSVLNHDPHQKDERTNHEALPVLEGEKYAANAWLHQRNFQLWHSRDCD